MVLFDALEPAEQFECESLGVLTNEQVDTMFYEMLETVPTEIRHWWIQQMLENDD